MKAAPLTVLCLLVSTAESFVVPKSTGFQTKTGNSKPTYSSQVAPSPKNVATASSSTQLHALPLLTDLVDSKQLMSSFLSKLIDVGVPAVVTLVTLAIAASFFEGDDDDDNDRKKNLEDAPKTAVTEMYEDLYGTKPTKGSGGGKSGLLNLLRRGRAKEKKPPINPGTPSKQYLAITNMNEKYDSYKYTITSATQSKAAASAVLRKQNFDRALSKVFDDGLQSFERRALLEAEHNFLTAGSDLMDNIIVLQTKIADISIRSQMEKLNVEVDELDPAPPNATDTATTNSTDSDEQKEKKKKNTKKSDSEKKVEELQSEMLSLQSMLHNSEIDFVMNVVEALGPDRANAVRAAILGDVATRGVGQMLTKLQDRPLSMILGDDNAGGDDSGETHQKKSLFVLDFPGDVQASQVNELREEVTAILRAARPGDEALMVLQSGGGTVTGYGLAAGQLKRFSQKGIKLTICVEQVAASGGYMMACTADKIIASPFAVLGSIGVITDIPNAYERLKKEGM